ncbi:PREDICTED: protein roadkill-like, partial [Rhagoletis zephyria]|uniref:protein roadkill-like n=1 Tax=Rhagoletis zephyria TaxID=28612 RepID=UPI0008117646
NCRISEFPDDQLKVLNLRDLKLLFGGSTCIIMHCEVFAAMFTNEGFLEATQKKLEIPDIPGEVMAVLLEYIYGGEIANVGPVVSELLEAADKYDIQPLIQICVSHMHKSICPQSAAKIFYIADLYRIEPLKSQAIDYICQHAAEVRESETWAQYVRPSSDLLEELFNNMANKRLYGSSGAGSSSSAGSSSAVSSSTVSSKG